MRPIPLACALIWLALACQKEGRSVALEAATQQPALARDAILTDLELDAQLELIAAIPHPDDQAWNASRGLYWSPSGETLGLRYVDYEAAQFWQVEPLDQLDYTTSGAVTTPPNQDGFVIVDRARRGVLRAVHRYSKDLRVKAELRTWESPCDLSDLSIHSSGELALVYSQWNLTCAQLVPLSGSHPPTPVLLPNTIGMAAKSAWIPNQDLFLWQPLRETCGNYDSSHRIGIEDLYLSDQHGIVQRGIADHYGPLGDLPVKREKWADVCLIGPVVEYAVAPDGRSLIYNAYRNQRGRLGRLLLPEFEHSHGRDDVEVKSICYLTSDRVLIAPLGDDALIELWDAEKLKRLKTLPVLGGLEIAASRDGSSLAIADNDRVRIYRVVKSAP